MNFGIYYSYWEKEWGGDAISYISRVKRLGFDTLEVATADFESKDISYFKEMKAIASDNGILLTGGYGPAKKNNIGTADKVALERALDYYKKMFSQMEMAGIQSLGGALYSYWPVTDLDFDKKADLERSILGMQKLADIAAEYGITLNMEALNRFEGYLINTCEECVNYVDAVGKTNVKVMLDTFHMNIEEDSFYDAICMAGSRLGHFHVGEANRKPPRAGRMPWKEIGDALRYIGYDGAVVMEPFVVPGGGVGRDIRIWREVVSDVSEDALDADVMHSVSFLKQTFQGEST